jgi:tetratricopeptide (TPR) repeat protein
LGQYDQALENYQHALVVYQKVGDRAGEGAVLNNIGRVYRALGQNDQALENYHQALSVMEELRNWAGERVSRYNLAMIYWDQGGLGEAVEELKQVVELDQLMQSPNLESDRAMLAQVQEEVIR